MFSFLKRLFGMSAVNTDLHAMPVQTCDAAAVVPVNDCNVMQTSIFSAEAAAFLLALVDIEESPLDLHKLNQDDLAFISGNIRKLQENSFEIPMLSQAATCIQQLMADPHVEATDFIDVIKEDPTLSIELLQMANSSYYGFDSPTLDLQQAIVRIGFDQLLGLVTMLSLRSQAVHCTLYNDEVDWVMAMSLAMARLCQQLAPEIGMKPGEAFTLGLLNHVEYLVVLGEASRATKESGRKISHEAIIETVHRLGSRINAQIAACWGGAGQLWNQLPNEIESEALEAVAFRTRINRLQRAMVMAIGDEEANVEIAGIERAHLSKAIEVALSQLA